MQEKYSHGVIHNGRQSEKASISTKPLRCVENSATQAYVYALELSTQSKLVTRRGSY